MSANTQEQEGFVKFTPPPCHPNLSGKPRDTISTAYIRWLANTWVLNSEEHFPDEWREAILEFATTLMKQAKVFYGERYLCDVDETVENTSRGHLLTLEECEAEAEDWLELRRSRLIEEIEWDANQKRPDSGPALPPEVPPLPAPPQPRGRPRKS